ncbi:MAG: flagellar motor protein MotA [Desulfobacteraceae bacterium]|nr:MAG: flagellar motor protein MotA [Desulfobacteraceae bacterium]
MKQGEKRLNISHINRNIIGLAICLGVFISGFFIHGNSALYLNLSGFLIVMGGTFGAILLSYRMERLKILVKVLKTAYGRPVRESDEIVQILVDLSVKKRIKGGLALQDEEDEISIIFLRQAIGFLIDGYSPEQIKEHLRAEMYFFRMRRDETLRVLQTMADIAPSFGLIGSVVGLIGMLTGAGNADVIMSTVPIALTSTLYGIVMANFLFLPFAACVKERTVQELFLQNIITEGVLAIAEDLHPRMLERKLQAFLTPSARQHRYVSYERIKQKFGLTESEENGNADNKDDGIKPQTV